MINKEALVAVVQVSVSDITLEKALLDQDVLPTVDYASANARSIDLAAICVLEGLISTADVSEGGFTVRYDRAAIERRIESLKYKTGIISAPVIRDASNKW
jgi:hypothetical protein